MAIIKTLIEHAIEKDQDNIANEIAEKYLYVELKSAFLDGQVPRHLLP